MNAKELAQLLNGRQYGDEIGTKECLQAKANGLLVIFGHSDDLIEIRGAFADEVSAYEGAILNLHREGNLDTDVSGCGCSTCNERLEKLAELCVTVICDWDKSGYSWFIEPKHVAFEPFDILEGKNKFCRGVVIETKNLPKIEGL